MCYSTWHRTLHFPNEQMSEIAVHVIVRAGFCVGKNEFECVINDLEVYDALFATVSKAKKTPCRFVMVSNATRKTL